MYVYICQQVRLYYNCDKILDMIRVILAIVRVSAKYRRQSPEGLPHPDSPSASLAASPEGFTKDALRSHLNFLSLTHSQYQAIQRVDLSFVVQLRASSDPLRPKVNASIDAETPVI